MENATVASVSSTPTSAFAAITSGRRGSSANVTIAERWLHSVVSTMIPSTGRRNDVRNAATPMKSPNAMASFCTVTIDSTMISAASTIRAIEASSQKPARVSYDLRSSTRTSRWNGVLAVPETSSVIALMSLHLGLQHPPDADRERDDEPQEAADGE